MDVFFPSWRSTIRANIPINSITQSALDNLKVKYPTVFDLQNDAPISGHEVSITLKEGATPVFHRPYTIPYAMIPVMDKILDSLIDRGVIYPVEHSRWASPVFLVPKKPDESRFGVSKNTAPNPVDENRLVVDVKRTVNPRTELKQYRMHTSEDIYSTLSRGAVFASWT